MRSDQFSTATASCPSRAAIAMVIDLDPSVGQLGWSEVPQFFCRGPYVNVEHLVKVAVEHVSLPIHAYEGSAHDVRKGLKVETVLQQVHVIFILVSSLQECGETINRHVGDRE